jgi:hypothetical protein
LPESARKPSACQVDGLLRLGCVLSASQSAAQTQNINQLDDLA